MNMLVRRQTGREYIITDFMATSLSRKKFEALQAVNQDKLGDWQWCDDWDWTWWDRVHKKLTATAIRRADYRFDINTGKVEQW